MKPWLIAGIQRFVVPPRLVTGQVLLTAQEDIEVVATAATGADAVAAAISHHIDVAILDIRMPGMDGIAAAQAILERKPECRIIMLTTFNNEELVARSSPLAPTASC